MAKQGAKTVTPRLRFREFRGDGDWALEELESVANVVSKKVQVSFLNIDNYVSTENLLPDYGEMVPATKLPDVASVTRFEPNDVLISNIRPYLKKVWRADRDGGASNDVIVVRAKDSIEGKFLSAVLRNDAFITYVMGGAKGVKMPRGDTNAIRVYPFAYPAPAEQQKIADCLTSLDEVIAAQGRKVEALKAHKRGLMQQLFPREGETRPRLRFPEFRNAPEWDDGRVGDTMPFITSGSRGWAAYYADTGSLFVRITNLSRASVFLDLSDKKFVALPPEATEGVRTQLKVGDVLISITADTGIIGFVDQSVQSPAYINQHIALVRFDGSKVSGKFVAYFLAAEVSQRQFRGTTDNGAKAGMNLTAVQNMKLWLPILTEQNRIADCLSSLDAQITADSNQLTALKTHKQGLMQQLFPAPDAASA